METKESNIHVFKVGDKVRRLKKWCCYGFEENKIYTISKVKTRNHPGYADIYLKETIDNDFQGPWDSNRFELIEVKYQIGKFYKNKIGGAVHECVDMTLGGLPVMKNTRNDGGKAPVFIYQGENLEEYTPPKTGKLWLNVYSDSDLYLYETRESADRHAGSDRLACVEVNWTEGQGL